LRAESVFGSLPSFVTTKAKLTLPTYELERRIHHMF
jgi:hypothetical protein